MKISTSIVCCIFLIVAGNNSCRAATIVPNNEQEAAVQINEALMLRRAMMNDSNGVQRAKELELAAQKNALLTIRDPEANRPAPPSVAAVPEIPIPKGDPFVGNQSPVAAYIGSASTLVLVIAGIFYVLTRRVQPVRLQFENMKVEPIAIVEIPIVVPPRDTAHITRAVAVRAQFSNRIEK